MRRREVPVAADGLLRTFAEAGMIAPVDFHLARRMAGLAGETRPQAELAFALCARELRLGSVCLDVASAHRLLPESSIDDGLAHEDAAALPWPTPEPWLADLAASPAVTGAEGAGGPFRLVGRLLYLDRFFTEERRVAETLRRRGRLSATPVGDDALTRALGGPPDAGDAQHLAVAAALTHPTTVITGGPGTGKTTTVSRILLGLADHDRPPLVALAAPTGKAATRLESAVREHLGDAPGLRLRASTLHRLLDIAPGRERETFDALNPLPHDVVVVDETSMVSLTLMAQLLTAVSDRTRLVLLGDPDQLESVEAGAVLADIASAPGLVSAGGSGAVVRLTTNWRSNAEINELATAIRTGDADAALALLRDGATVSLAPFTGTEAPMSLPTLATDVLAIAEAVRLAAEAGDGVGANKALERHRILCAHREGPFGVAHWGHAARSWLAGRLPGYADAPAWVGQPLLITRGGDQVSNGDTGVVVNRGGRLVACIERGGSLLWRDPGALDDVADLHAMTIHKSQGSQFDLVSVVLPPVGSPLLTRQLLYTAVTRAKEGVRLYGSPDALATAILTPARRASGLSA